MKTNPTCYPLLALFVQIPLCLRLSSLDLDSVSCNHHAAGGGGGGGGGAGGGGGGSMQRTMLLCNKLGQMNSEFQVLLSTIDVFCHSADTARNIAACQKESSERVENAPARHKRQNKLHHTRKSEVIPIQLVTGYHSRNVCVISATSMSSILVSNGMRCVLPNTCFVDFVRNSAGCPDSVRQSMNCVEAREDRNIALGRDASGATKDDRRGQVTSNDTARCRPRD